MKEREGNVVILGVPDDQESLEGATTDEETLDKIWTAVGVDGVAGTHRRLERPLTPGQRRCTATSPPHPIDAC